MSDVTPEQFLDGFALWDEHSPQSGEDWVAVAERFIAAGDSTAHSSPLFAAVVLAVRRAGQAEQDVEALIAALACPRCGGTGEGPLITPGWMTDPNARTIRSRCECRTALPAHLQERVKEGE